MFQHQVTAGPAVVLPSSLLSHTASDTACSTSKPRSNRESICKNAPRRRFLFVPNTSFIAPLVIPIPPLLNTNVFVRRNSEADKLEVVAEDTISFQVPESDAQNRLDKVLAAQFPQHSRQYLQSLVSDGHVLVSEAAVKKKNAKVAAGLSITVRFVSSKPLRAEPDASILLDVLYEDEDILIINKPAGLVVHPCPGHWSGTLVNALVHHCAPSELFLQRPTSPSVDQSEEEEDVSDDIEVADDSATASRVLDALRPGIVHRLDKDTSGCIVTAKTVRAQRRLLQLFQSRQVQKSYLAVVVGSTQTAGQDVVIDAPIGRDPNNRQLMRVTDSEDEGGRAALSVYRRIAQNEAMQLSVVNVRIATGRTHQIRVHMRHIGSPVLGDTLYGLAGPNKKYSNLAPRQLLHAYRLRFAHPVHEDVLIDIVAPPPADMLHAISRVDPSLAHLLSKP